VIAYIKKQPNDGSPRKQYHQSSGLFYCIGIIILDLFWTCSMVAVQTCLANNLSSRVCQLRVFSFFLFSSQNTIYYSYHDGCRISKISITNASTGLKVAVTTNIIINLTTNFYQPMMITLQITPPPQTRVASHKSSSPCPCTVTL